MPKIYIVTFLWLFRDDYQKQTTVIKCTEKNKIKYINHIIKSSKIHLLLL